ncbi:hypothetical protein ACFU99_14145 [Streptomyces sp. NPDC057654]|uniref:hypothetical protein n=1 Tax=Streptomyces sp. NPDC057654 TaxID=3346196 RepID=UPI0036AC241A
MTTISIAGLEPAAVLAALTNHARPYGMGAAHPDAGREVTVAAARAFLDNAKTGAEMPELGPGGHVVERADRDPWGRLTVDSLYGRTLHLVFEGDTVHVETYEHDHGAGLADRALTWPRSARASPSSNSPPDSPPGAPDSRLPLRPQSRRPVS